MASSEIVGAYLKNIVFWNDNNGSPDSLHFYSQQTSTTINYDALVPLLVEGVI